MSAGILWKKEETGSYMETREVLEQVRSGVLSVEEAEKYFRKQPFVELGYAKLDSHREIRSGFPEVIYCSGKPDAYLVSIYQKMYAANGEAFGTRADRHQYEAVKAVIPEIVYDEISRILKIEKNSRKRMGRIAVCTAGTADIPVAEEAAQTAEYFGSCVERVYDVGGQRSAQTAFQAGCDTVRQLCGCGGGHGRRACQCDWRTCESSGDRGADFHRVWRQHAWFVGSADDD